MGESAEAAGNGHRGARHRASGELPLSFTQQRLWFLQRLDPALTAYNIPHVLDPARLAGHRGARARLAEIVRRHEVLRTVFPTVDGFRPVPERWPADAVSARARRERQGGLARRRSGARELRMRLQELHARTAIRPETTGPLVRPRPGPHRRTTSTCCSCSCTTSCSTAVSIDAFLQRARAQLYEGPTRRAARRPLPELPIQYVGLRRLAAGAALKARRSSSEMESSGAMRAGGNLPVLELPLDYDRDRRCRRTPGAKVTPAAAGAGW